MVPSAAGRLAGIRGVDTPGEAGPANGDGVGIPLYNVRRVMVKCYAEGRLQQPGGRSGGGLGDLPRPKSFARVAVAGDGRLWFFFRHHPLPGGGGETGPSMPCPTTARPGASRGC